MARELGISVGVLNNVLNGLREPGPKVLKSLGIRVERSYVLEPNSEIPEGIAARAPVKRPKRRKASIDDLPKGRVIQRTPLPDKTVRMLEAAIAVDAPKLNTMRVKIAMRYQLNPAQSWASFIDGCKGKYEHLDEVFEEYCTLNGTAPIERPKEQETLGKPGELYAHLKPVNRGIDHRKPRAFGERPEPVMIDQPEVGL